MDELDVADVNRRSADAMREALAQSKWDVREGADSLEFQSMAAKFDGFEDGMFDFLSRPQRDADHIKWIHGRMEQFGQKLLSKGLQALDPSFYKKYHVGNFYPDEDDHFWVAFGPDDFTRLSQSAHQSVSLYAAWLDVFVCVELAASISLLRQSIRSNEKAFVGIIAGVPEPFQLELGERTRRSPTKFAYSPPIVTLTPAEARDPTSNGFLDLVRRLMTIEYPHFSLRRRLDKERVLELGGGPWLMK